MNEIIRNYFLDPLPEGHYAQTKIFYPPAAPEDISNVEKALSVIFPADYLAFLQHTNGYDGNVGQSYARFIPVDQIEEYTSNYGKDIFPWIVCIGTDGGNEMYVIDKRSEPLQFGLLPFIGDEKDFIALGHTFESFVKHLYNKDFW